MSVREIVTLQIGHYANYVGAHWWNIQESSFVYDPAMATGPNEICHDVLFREGRTLQNEVTFTPRLVAFDLKGSLHTLKQEGTLYDTGTDEGEEIKWVGDVTMHEEEMPDTCPILQMMNAQTGSKDTMADSQSDDEKAEELDGVIKKRQSECDDKMCSQAEGPALYKLDDSITVWSDFLRTQYHPRSIHLVEEYRHEDEYHSFDLFSCASEVLGSYDWTCQWEDRLHHFTEECDALQGFHVLVDTHNGFGGLSGGLLRHIDDEYPGKGILTFGFTPSHLPDDTAKVRAARIINSALAYNQACNHSSLFVPASLAKGLWRSLDGPVCFPDMSYQSVPFHTSAILAASLDTLSLPYRLESGAINIRDITHSFNAQGRIMASLNTSMPIGLHINESIVDFLCVQGDFFPWQPLTPHMKNTEIPIIQSVVMRGVTDSQVPTKTDMRKLPDHMRRLNTRQECMTEYLANKCAGSLYAVNCLEAPVKTVIPFPHIFNKEVNKGGYKCGMPRPQGQGVESIPQITSLQSNTELGSVIRQLHSAASRMNIKKYHRYLELGLEEDEYTEVLDGLETLAGKYVTESEGL